MPICLLLSLKKICIRGFHAWPDEIEVVKYLLKHGEVLNTVKICPYFLSFRRRDEAKAETVNVPKGFKDLSN